MLITRLFWCSTRDHSEDMFLAAACAEDAKDFFADYLGYETSEISVRPVDVPFPTDVDDATPFIVDEDLLKTLGATFGRKGHSPVIFFGARHFVLDDLERGLGMKRRAIERF